ncbi:MAG: hypothetical protein Q9209_001950 [Squamulea sp. 1 TL-2023]
MSAIPNSQSLPKFTDRADFPSFPRYKTTRRAVPDERLTEQAPKRRLVAFFVVALPDQDPQYLDYDDGLDHVMDLMTTRSKVAGKMAKVHEEKHNQLDGLIKGAVAGFSAKPEPAPSEWVDPPYALEKIMWAIEWLESQEVDCQELRDVLSKIVLGVKDMEDLERPFLEWKTETPW